MQPDKVGVRFILNRNVEVAVATREDIYLAINRFYGMLEGESADSILQEFADTVVDFTESVDHFEYGVDLHDAADLHAEHRLEILDDFGGGQVKQFAVDFAGESVLTIPLATTGTSFAHDGSPAAHHFSILIRNMYDEERIACPAFLKVNVMPSELVSA